MEQDLQSYKDDLLSEFGIEISDKKPKPLMFFKDSTYTEEENGDSNG